MDISIDYEAVVAGIKEIATETLVPSFAAVTRHQKSDGSFITETDIRAQELTAALLHQLTPSIPMLGEEMSASKQQQLISNSSLLWCLDPLDGTTNFSGGLPYFSISLALLAKGEALFALVYDPMRNECFTAHKGDGSCLNGTRLRLPATAIPLDNAIGLIDFKQLPTPLAIALATSPPYASQRSLGSVALDWCWLATNRCQLYLHSRQKLWDFAAGLLIFNEAGGLHATINGTPLDYSHLNSQIAYAATHPALFQQWQNWLHQY